MKNSDVTVILTVAILIIAGAATASYVCNSHDPEGYTCTWSYSAAIIDGTQTSAYNGQQVTAEEAYWEAVGWVTAGSSSDYVWASYTITWTAPAGTYVCPGGFKLSGSDATVGTAGDISVSYGVGDLLFGLPIGDSDIPISSSIPIEGTLTMTIVLPVHEGVALTASYWDGESEWTAV